MNINNENRIILSISSDIGYNLAKDWIKKGHHVYGSYNKKSQNVVRLQKMGAKVFYCNLSKENTINRFLKNIKKIKWQVLVLAAGSQKPIGRFDKVNFKSWEKSIDINFIKQLKVLHAIVKNKKKKSRSPIVLFFAGGGTNNATLNYSAYTISKIASIKMVELLDAELKDIRFVILGPGWVKTKIHQQTLNAKIGSGKNYFRTKLHFKENNFYAMEKVIKCCNWLIASKRSLISGRNFSAVNDPWENKKIIKINKDYNNFKLRRFGNEIFKK